MAGSFFYFGADPSERGLHIHFPNSNSRDTSLD